MRIGRFEDIEAWQLARELTGKVYCLTKNTEFARDFGLKGQIQDAAGSSEEFRGSKKSNPEPVNAYHFYTVCKICTVDFSGFLPAFT